MLRPFLFLVLSLFLSLGASSAAYGQTSASDIELTTQQQELLENIQGTTINAIVYSGGIDSYLLYADEQGQLQGFYIESIHRLLSSLNIDYAIVPLSAVEYLERLKQNRPDDLFWGVYNIRDRHNEMLLSNSVYEIELVAVSAQGQRINSVRSFEELLVGAPNFIFSSPDIYLELLYAYPELEQMDPQFVSNIQDIELQSRENTYLIEDFYAVQGWAVKNGLSLTRLHEEFKIPVAIAFPQSMQWLHQLVNDNWRQLQSSSAITPLKINYYRQLLNLNSNEIDYLNDNPILKVYRPSVDIAPYFFDDNGTFTGAAVELFDMLTQVLSVDVVYTSELAQADLFMYLPIDLADEAEQYHLFDDIYNENIAVYNRRQDRNLRTYKDLFYQKLGTLHQGYVDHGLSKENKQLRLTRYTTVQNGLEALNTGQIDYFVGERDNIEKAIVEGKFFDIQLSNLVAANLLEPMRPATLKTNDALVRIMERYFYVTSSDIFAINKAWQQEKLQLPVDYSLLWRLSAIAGIIILILTVAFTRTNRLKRELDITSGELVQKQRQIQAMIDNVPVALFIKDVDDNYLVTNQIFKNVLEVEGEDVNNALTPEFKAQLRDREDQVIRLKETVQFEADWAPAGKAPRTYQVNKAPMVDTDGNVDQIVGMYLDITPRKQLERRLTIERDKSALANQAKSDFLAAMSHELRTPLNGVIGMLSLIQKNKLNAHQQHQLGTAASSANTLLTLINDILDFSKIDAGKMSLDNVDFDLSQLLSDISGNLSTLAHKKGLELIFDLPDDLPKQLNGDPVRLRQILFNLIGNAIKFTQEGQVVLHLRFEFDGDQVQVIGKVIDSGIGIAKNKQADLFDAFTQAESGTSRNFEGTGLGLAITRSLCRLMDGDIDVDSDMGKGSTFAFRLCMAKSDSVITSAPSLQIDDCQVLIVDDNSVNREIYRRQLTNVGAKVTEAASGVEALKICISDAQQHFDVVLLDMNMPSVDGMMFSRLLRGHEQYDKTRILLLTSSMYMGSPQEQQEAGIDGTLTKPILPDELYSAISILLDQGEQMRANQQLLTQAYLDVRCDHHDTDTESVSYQWPESTKILLVDDNLTNRMVAEGFLNSIGLECDHAEDGIIALEKLSSASAEQPYTMVLMDCQMPKMNGYDATREIRKGNAGRRYQQIPVLAMTAHAQERDRQFALNAGMNDYLTKPLDFELCTRALEKWLGETSDTVPPADAGPKKPENQTFQLPEALRTIDFNTHRPGIADLPKVYLKSLQAYVRQYQSILPTIAAMDLSQNQQSLRSLAHSLKGSGGNLGMMPMYELAKNIEEQIDEGGASSRAQRIQLSDLLADTIDDANLIIEANSILTEVSANHSQQHFDQTRTKLVTALRSGEVVSQELIDEFAQQAKSSKQVSDVEAIVTALEDFDYELALQQIEEA